MTIPKSTTTTTESSSRSDDNAVSLDERRVEKALRATLQDWNAPFDELLDEYRSYPRIIREFSAHYLRAIA